MLETADSLKHIKVRFLFPDKEELGLIGSKGYIKNHGVSDVAGVVSFDMCGIGNAFGIWDIQDNLENSAIVRALQNAGTVLNVYNATHGPVPRYSSDHHEFFLKGVPAVGVTILPKEDESILRDYMANPYAFKWLSISNRPVIFQTYHKAEDRPDTVEPKALDITAQIIVKTITEFDQLMGSD
jgi:hypothetical protein